MYPIVIGGNGHSGTRLFADILMECGVSMGIAGISHSRVSKDLNVRGLMNRWVKPYLLGLSKEEASTMKRQFDNRDESKNGVYMRPLSSPSEFHTSSFCQRGRASSTI